MNYFRLIIIVSGLLVISACQSANKKAGGGVEEKTSETANSEITDKKPEDEGIHIIKPEAGSAVSSPLKIEGEAKGSWYFEAEFTVHLEQNGKTLADTIVHARGDWMTSDFVPFFTTLIFPESIRKGDAFLVFKNSNASGKPELDKSYRLPVKIN